MSSLNKKPRYKQKKYPVGGAALLVLGSGLLIGADQYIQYVQNKLCQLLQDNGYTPITQWGGPVEAHQDIYHMVSHLDSSGVTEYSLVDTHWNESLVTIQMSQESTKGDLTARGCTVDLITLSDADERGPQDTVRHLKYTFLQLDNTSGFARIAAKVAGVAKVYDQPHPAAVGYKFVTIGENGGSRKITFDSSGEDIGKALQKIGEGGASEGNIPLPTTTTK